MPDRPCGIPGISGMEYDARFTALERAGKDVHGEANFIAALGVSAVLDAGCGTGRVAIELARRGCEVAGIDRDPEFIRLARQKAPGLTWLEADLATFTLSTPENSRRCFEAIVLAGNVMLFLDPGSEATVMANMARHLAPGGFLVAGFQLHQPGKITLACYDAYATRAGLTLVERWSTWERAPWEPTSDYAVSVHRRPPVAE